MRSLGIAVGLFLLLCGGLFLATNMSTEPAKEATEDPVARSEPAPNATFEKLRACTESVEKAQLALERADYGEARSLMEKARRQLGELVYLVADKTAASAL